MRLIKFARTPACGWSPTTRVLVIDPGIFSERAALDGRRRRSSSPTSTPTT